MRLPYFGSSEMTSLRGLLPSPTIIIIIFGAARASQKFIALPSPPPTRRFNFRHREWKEKQREGKMCRKGHRQLPSSILPSDLNFPEVSPWNQNSFLFLYFSFLMRRCAAAAVLYVLPTHPPPFLQFLPRFFSFGKERDHPKNNLFSGQFSLSLFPRFGGWI